MGLKTLTQLHMRSTGITDAGLEHLIGMTNLIEVDIAGTKVTTAGVEKLKAALPRCKVVWDEAKK